MHVQYLIQDLSVDLFFYGILGCNLQLYIAFREIKKYSQIPDEKDYYLHVWNLSEIFLVGHLCNMYLQKKMTDSSQLIL